MMKKNLYVISGVTGMTGSELARQLLARGEAVFGFDNFFASSIDTVCDILDDTNFVFCEYNITINVSYTLTVPQWFILNIFTASTKRLIPM